MKTLILLLFFLLPGPPVQADGDHLLNLQDYEVLSEDLHSLPGVDPRIAAESKIELIRATDPKCFE